MALKKLPGGVVVETTAGARLNEEAGINLEAIHRQIVAGTPTTPAGWGVRNPVGPTVRGQFLTATNADGGTTGQWATIRIQATGY